MKKHLVVDGTDHAFRWAKKHGANLAFGTDILPQPDAATNQITDVVEPGRWFAPAQALKVVTHDNAKRLTLSGTRNQYPCQLGVVKAGAHADLLLVDGDPGVG